VALYTPDERDAIATRLRELIADDERVAHVELGGSGASGYADRWSDVDLVVKVAEGLDQREVADALVERIYAAVPVLHHFAIAFGDEHVRGFLLENLLEVDLGFQPATGREDGDWPGPDPDREAGFAWHDAVHAGVAAARGRPWRAQYYIGLLRWRTLALATHRLGLELGEYKGVDDLPAEILDPLEEALPRSLDPAELSRAARAATRAFLGELRQARPELSDRLAEPLLEFLDASLPEPA
jgi:predicted nucleotidyltransferase